VVELGPDVYHGSSGSGIGIGICIGIGCVGGNCGCGDRHIWNRSGPVETVRENELIRERYKRKCNRAMTKLIRIRAHHEHNDDLHGQHHQV
jgi:hypothetical protein